MVILKGKGFILRPLSLKDSDLYLEMMRDPETRKGFMYPPQTLNEVKKKLKIKLEDEKKGKRESFAIEVDGEFAGYVELHDLNEKHFKHRGAIGYALRKKFRGKGLTTAANKIVSNYAFKKYKLKRLEGFCRTFNKASARVLEKSGFKLEGILRKNKCKNGKYLDDMVWAKVK
jgi:ribosomal-protein-alanine N-acetyltransferase